MFNIASTPTRVKGENRCYFKPRQTLILGHLGDLYSLVNTA